MSPSTPDPSAKRGRGRPTRYTNAAVEKILIGLAEGKTLIGICESDPSLPAESTVRNWALEDRNGFFARYARARDIGLHHHADLIIEISDKPNVGQRQYHKIGQDGKKIVEVVISDNVDRDRLRVDSRKWYLAKLAPKRYSDRAPLDNDSKAPEKVNENLLAELADAIRQTPVA